MTVAPSSRRQFLRPVPGMLEYERRADAASPDQLIVFVGTRSGAAAHRRIRDGILCPIDADPNVWKWSSRWRYVAVLHASAQVKPFVEQLVRALLDAGAAVVSVQWKDEDRIEHRIGHQGIIEETDA